VALRFGRLEVDPPVVLAPMAGVTNAPFRRLCRRYGAGLYVSEMVTARALVERNERTRRMVHFDDDEAPRSVQLYGVTPLVMGEAVRQLVDEVGVDHIDMNFGCPAAKVTRKGGGAALPVHHVLFRAIVRAAVRAAGDVPVTVKLRMGVDDDHLNFLDSARAAEDEGAAAVALHARTAEQLYSGDAHWDAIAELKRTVTSIPVLGNGDIWEAADALRMVAETGCDGVVVGRGCLGRPWLFGDLVAAFAGAPIPPAPDLGEVMATMKLHLHLLADLLGEEGAARDFRKHTAWYMTGFSIGGEKRKALSNITSFADLDRLLDDLDPTMPFPPEAHRLKRGHTRGPRPVHLPDRWLQTADDPNPLAGAELLVSGG
jgi:nifR3 family TIM-barrel protein